MSNTVNSKEAEFIYNQLLDSLNKTFSEIIDIQEKEIVIDEDTEGMPPEVNEGKIRVKGILLEPFDLRGGNEEKALNIYKEGSIIYIQTENDGYKQSVSIICDFYHPLDLINVLAQLEKI